MPSKYCHNLDVINYILRQSSISEPTIQNINNILLINKLKQIKK